MAKVTRITIEFDDGTTHDVDPATSGSIFMSADKAKASGKKEPWKKAPQEEDVATATAGECYLVNGIIVCP